MELPNIPIPKYKYITKADDAREALAIIDNYPEFELDTEGTSLDPFDCESTLLQIGTGDNVFVFDIRHKLPDVDIHGSMFEKILTDRNKTKILQNAGYDMSVLKTQYGFYIEGVYDTFVAERLLNLGRPFIKAGLAALVQRYVGFNMPKEAQKTFSNYYQVFTEEQLNYAATDVCALSTIKDQQLFEIKKWGLERSLALELDFITPMIEMSLNGIKMDAEKWRIIMSEAVIEEQQLFFKVSKELQKVDRQTSLFDVPIINVRSNEQVLYCLNRMGIDIKSTGKDVLKDYVSHPIVQDILDWRQLSKLITTYGESLLAQIHPKTGRLHTSFTQMVDTGRLSSREPNLQNIPKKQKYRACFIAEQGKGLLTADMSSAELRILGNFSKDPTFLEAYASGIDVHQANASRIFNVPYDKVSTQQRNASKAISFGLCLSEETQVYTTRGLLPISDLVIDDIVVDDTTSRRVIDHKHTGEKECFRITTKYGYFLEATAEHKLFVIDANGSYVEKPLSDLDLKNDHICLRKGANVFSDEEVYFPDFVVDRSTNYKHVELPKHLDATVAAFLGLFVAEGCVQKVKGRSTHELISFKFSNKNPQFISLIDELLGKVFSTRLTRIAHPDGVSYAHNSVLFSEWLVSLLDGYCPRLKSSSIRVPGCIKQAKKEIQQVFLAWLFEGDGTIKFNGNANKVCYSSKSNKLIEDLQIMLLNFGIVTSVTKDFHKDYPGEEYYILSILGNDGASKFIEEIGFVTAYKQARYLGVIDVGQSYFFVPNQEARLLEMKSVYSASKDKEDYVYDSLYNCLHNLNNKIGNKHLGLLYKYDSSGLLKYIYDNNLVCLPIKHVEAVGVKTVYDISIDQSERFLANGFIVHNCYGLSAHGLSARLRISKSEAEKLISSYFNTNKGVHLWLEQAKRSAVARGYSETVIGRKRFYKVPALSDPERRQIIGSIERKAMNHPIQGCLTGDTIVKGLGYIKDFVGKEVEVSSFGIKNKGIVVYSGKKGVWELTLSNGTVLKITKDHKIPVINHLGKLYNKAVYKIRGDDLLLSVVQPKDPYYEVHPLNKKVEAYINKKWGKKPRTQLIYEFCNKVSLRKYSVEDTYDIICEDDPHYFIANGIVVHNSNADTIKYAMIKCFNALKPYGDRAKLILTVHDEIIVECDEELMHEVAPIVSDSLIAGFGECFDLIPMESETLISPCWMKGVCEAEVDGKKCGSPEFEFKPDAHYKTKLFCKKCGTPQ